MFCLLTDSLSVRETRGQVVFLRHLLLTTTSNVRCYSNESSVSVSVIHETWRYKHGNCIWEQFLRLQPAGFRSVGVIPFWTVFGWGCETALLEHLVLDGNIIGWTQNPTQHPRIRKGLSSLGCRKQRGWSDLKGNSILPFIQPTMNNEWVPETDGRFASSSGNITGWASRLEACLPSVWSCVTRARLFGHHARLPEVSGCRRLWR